MSEIEAGLRDLIQRIKSRRPRDVLAALSDTVPLLEFNNFAVSDPEYYEQVVPAALRERPLSADEQVLIVQVIEEAIIEELITRRESTLTGLLSTLRQAHLWDAAPVLLEILVNEEPQLSVKELHAAVDALFGSLQAFDDDDPHVSDVRATFGALDPRPVLNRARRMRPAEPHGCLPEDAEWILRRLSERNLIT
jgi:hypothetical protein